MLDRFGIEEISAAQGTADRKEAAVEIFIQGSTGFFLFGGASGVFRCAFSGLFPSPAGAAVQVLLLLLLFYAGARFQKRRAGRSTDRAMLEHSGCAVFDYGVAEKTVRLSEGARKLCGLPQNVRNIPELLDSGIIHPDGAARLASVGRKALNGTRAGGVLRIRGASGEYRWFRITLTPFGGKQGGPEHIFGVLQDVTAQKEAELNCRRERKYRKAILGSSLASFEANFTLGRYYGGGKPMPGLPSEDGLDYSGVIGQFAGQSVFSADREEFLRRFSLEGVINQFIQGETKLTMECRLCGKDGSCLWVLFTVSLIEDTHDVWGIAYVKNIDSQKRRELSLREKAERDSLSGLYNKGMTESLISEFLENQAGGIHALLILDVDNFKQINDTKGHQAGDSVLARLSGILRRIFRSADIVGRIGGDEFLVLLKDIGSGEMAARKAREVCRALCVCVGPEEREFCSVSVGIAMYPQHGTCFSELYRKADTALYQAKYSGKNRYVLYEESSSPQFWDHSAGP